MLTRIRSRNPALSIKTADDLEFARFGAVVSGYDFTEIISYVKEKTPMPEAGNAYVADMEDTHEMDVFNQLKDGCFGGMPIQMGYCNGYNGVLNALEFHKGSEIVIPATDCVMQLASLPDIKDGTLRSEKICFFYVNKGQAVELYGPTLHFAPCAVDSEGYKTAIVLPQGTNMPLPVRSAHEPMLRATNKWLIAHPECQHLASSGAYVGIAGENFRISY
jgi:hypothetical protein